MGAECTSPSATTWLGSSGFATIYTAAPVQTSTQAGSQKAKTGAATKGEGQKGVLSMENIAERGGLRLSEIAYTVCGTRALASKKIKCQHAIYLCVRHSVANDWLVTQLLIG